MRVALVLLVAPMTHLVLAATSLDKLPGETDLSCTDDSDCIPLGHKFGCFLYRCCFRRFQSVFTHSTLLNPGASTLSTPTFHTVNSPTIVFSAAKVVFKIQH